jgi:hypothetical protein
MELNIQTLTAVDYDIRTTTYDGKEYIIVPVVMMVEGVHSGSHGALFHSAAELGRYPASWDGRPVVIHHPEVNGMAVSANRPDISEQETVGYVFNTTLDGSKLKAEAWLCLERLTRVSPETLQHINDKKPLDVSVGVFTDEEQVAGVWQGESYQAIAHNHRPDHLAILPGATGACSFDDGCGIRNNSKIETNVEITDKVKKTLEVLKGVPFAVVSESQLTNNEADYKALVQSIQRKLDRMDTDNKVHWLVALYEDRFIYKMATNNGEEYYQRGYETMQDGEVDFDTNVMRMQITYQPMGQSNKFTRNINNNKGGDMSGTQNPCCPDKVKELIANAATKFTEGDKDWLLTQSAETIAKLFPNEQEPEKVTVNKEQALEVLKEYLSDKDTVMKMLPDEMRTQLEYGLEAYNQNRTKLISGIVANSNNQFKEDDLKDMEMPMLQKIYKSVVKVDYSANGSAGAEVNDNKETDGVEPLMAPGIISEKEDK